MNPCGYVSVSGSRNLSTAEVFEISAVWEPDVSLEESREGLKSWDNYQGLGTGPGSTTDFARGSHVLSPLPPQKKRDSKGVLDDCVSCYNKCCKTMRCVREGKEMVL